VSEKTYQLNQLPDNFWFFKREDRKNDRQNAEGVTNHGELRIWHGRNPHHTGIQSFACCFFMVS